MLEHDDFISIIERIRGSYKEGMCFCRIELISTIGEKYNTSSKIIDILLELGVIKERIDKLYFIPRNNEDNGDEPDDECLKRIINIQRNEHHRMIGRTFDDHIYVPLGNMHKNK